MKFNINSINDERAYYKARIRANAGCEEVHIPTFNAYEQDVQGELAALGFDSVWGNAKKGEVGVWISNYNCWKWVSEASEPLLVFEDDAVVYEHFDPYVKEFEAELPDDWDFAALWVPENQRIDYQYNLRYNEIGDPIIFGTLPYGESLFAHSQRVAHVYQGYGMVALMYSPAGGRKLVDLAHKYGIYTPVDCFVYQQAHMGNLNGYAPTPGFANLVQYDWSQASHVQQTERVEL